MVGRLPVLAVCNKLHLAAASWPSNAKRSIVVFKCTRCQKEFSDDQRLAIVDEPYCEICWYIVYYQFPEAKLKPIMALLERVKQQGQPQESLDRILLAELKRYAAEVVKKNLSQTASLVDSIQARALARQGKNNG